MTAAINQAFAEPADAPFEESRLLTDGAVVGKWRILALVGKGGFGEVYRVEHVKSGAIGALKVLGHDNPDQRRRFDLESEILQKISSSASEGTRHFPRFLGDGIMPDKGLPYIVIEFLSEFKIPDAPSPRMRDSDVAKLILGVCAAIQELHKNGYLHRDIKPENLMQRENGDVVLIDFGLGIRIKDIENPLADRVSVAQGHRVGVGTPGSTAPEQAFGSASVSGDVYALGALAEKCFRGKPPARWIPILQKAGTNIEFRYQNPKEFESAVRSCVLWTKVSRIVKICGLCIGLLLCLMFVPIITLPNTNPQRESEASSNELEKTVSEQPVNSDGVTATETCDEQQDFRAGINPRMGSMPVEGETGSSVDDGLTVKTFSNTLWNYGCYDAIAMSACGQHLAPLVISMALRDSRIAEFGKRVFKGGSSPGSVTNPANASEVSNGAPPVKFRDRALEYGKKLMSDRNWMSGVTNLWMGPLWGASALETNSCDSQTNPAVDSSLRGKSQAVAPAVR